MPTYNISDSPLSTNVKEYIKNTNSKLTIKSVVTDSSVEFPAFLTDFSQTFDASWNTEEVFGRMDPIATYQGTKRTMSLGFDVPAGTLKEAQWNLKTCSLLTTMVYPVYNGVYVAGKRKNETDPFSSLTKVPGGVAVLAKPPLVRVKFANLIDSTIFEAGERVDLSNPLSPLKKEPLGLLGWITGLSWKPNLEMGMFTGEERLFPKIISISFSFNILHEKVLDQPSLAETNWPFGD